MPTPPPGVRSDRQYQCLYFWVLQAKQAVISGSPTGVQKQGHVNPELLFKQGQDLYRLAYLSACHAPPVSMGRGWR